MPHRQPSLAGIAALVVVLLALAAALAPGGAHAAALGGPISFPVGAGPLSVAVGDFNGDSDPDIAVANVSSNDVSILVGNGSAGFAPAPGSPLPAGSGPISVAVGDFNGDSDPDLAVANLGSYDVSILVGGAGASFTPGLGSPIPVGANPRSVAVGDFNGDSDPDLAVANSGSNDVSLLLGGTGASFTPVASPIAANTFPRSVAVGDFNGDGDPDLAVANFVSHDVSILLGGLGASFTPATGSPYAAGTTPDSVALGDFNGDSDPDLAIANYITNAVSVLLGGADGTFSPAPGSPYAAGWTPSSVAVGDFNGDTHPDLAVANYESLDVTLLLGGAGANFTAAPGSPFPAGGCPEWIAVGDFNSDSRPDVVVVNADKNTVSILLASAPPTLAIDDVTHPEGNSATTPYTFTVTRSGDTSAAASVQWATADGSASAPGDYVQAAGALQFAPGELSKTITVSVRGDTTPEPNETFEVRLSGAQGAQITDGEGVGVIVNDDLSPSARCTITGTNKNDVISGTPGDDVICAGNGDDRIFGLGGRDVLIGGNGKDTLAGGPGADLLVGGNGKDTLDARDGAPNDVADGGNGPDVCRSDVGDFVAGCP